MTQQPEQIGELVYLPNPEYPYPFPVEQPPHFWMTEQTGQLATAVDAYFNGEKLERGALDLIQQYLRQYLERAVVSGGANRNLLLARIEKLRTARDIQNFADELAEVGVEPF
jgi:hypothetical protein